MSAASLSKLNEIGGKMVLVELILLKIDLLE